MAHSFPLPRVLLITAHPDDETLFNLGRLTERGWPVAVVLVTNGEGGAVVQGIRPDYDPKRDDDILIEKQPGNRVWLTRPPNGPRLMPIRTTRQLALERRREFLAGMRRHRVATVYFLSGMRDFAFEDSWDNGVRNWDVFQLSGLLKNIAQKIRPDIVVTMNPDETWAHPQHQGLGRIVHHLHQMGAFDRLNAPRPMLFGLREHGWYPASLMPQAGDVRFDRQAWSPVLQMSYANYWRRVTSTYLSQSSHPIWFAARAGVGLLPGYGDVDLLRRLDCGSCADDLDQLLQRYPPSTRRLNALPKHPRIVRFGE